MLQYAFNLFSHNAPMQENGYNEEEMKMVKETHKIWRAPDVAITATCIRVPVMRAHAESINLELENELSEDEVSSPGQALSQVSLHLFVSPLSPTVGNQGALEAPSMIHKIHSIQAPASWDSGRWADCCSVEGSDGAHRQRMLVCRDQVALLASFVIWFVMPCRPRGY